MVILYSKPSCVQCTASERKLKELGIEHVKIDLTKDTEAFAKVLNWGYQQAPVVETPSGSHWSGYRPDLIEALVG